MTAFRDAFTILYTPDVERSFAFCRDLLGFEELHRNHTPDGAVALWFYTDDVDAQVERLRASGVPVQLEPADMPWGERMAFVSDPEGNRIVTGARLDAPS